jgi:branched-chain amino acid transport system substrate-binding protein
MFTGRVRTQPVRPSRLVPFALALAATFACEHKGRPIIGFAIQVPRPNAVQVARTALRPDDPLIIDVTDSLLHRRWTGDAGDVESAARFAGIKLLVAVVGHASSGGSLAAAPIYAEAGIPLVVPTGTSRLLRRAGSWVFPLSPDDSTEGAFLAAFVADRLHARTVSIFYDDDTYGVGIRDAVVRALAPRGTAIRRAVAVSGACPSAQGVRPEPSLDLAASRRNPPDVIVLALRTDDALCLARAIRARGVRSAFVGGDGVEVSAPFLRGAPDSFYVAAFWHAGLADARSQAFVRDFQRLAGRTPLPQDALQYDAIMLLAEAVRAVGPNRTAVRDYLRSLGKEWPAYAGITGAIATEQSRPLYMLKLRAGAVEAVFP